MALDPNDLCAECKHRRADHRSRGGVGSCLGLGNEKAMLGTFCTCPRWREPKPQTDSYSTYTASNGARRGFSASSSRYEIGDGRPRRTSDLQRKSLGPESKEQTPEWVMFGVRQPDGGVKLYASTALSYLSMRQDPGHFEELHEDLIRQGVLADAPWDLSGRMVGYIPIEADNYVEALSRLMQAGWRPDGEPEGPSTADLQRQAALEELRREEERNRRLAIEAPLDEVVDAEVVEDE